MLQSGIRTIIRLFIPVLLMLGTPAPGAAQSELRATADLSRNPEWFPGVYKPYTMRKISEVELHNSESVLQLIRGEKLLISLSQLKTAVHDNNLDILSSNNNARYAQTDILRAKGGGAPRGGAGLQIPSSLFAGAIGVGVESAGTQDNFASAGGITGGGRQIFGFPSGSYDPTLTLGFGIDQTTSPLNSIIVSGLPEVTTKSIGLQALYSQAFTSGTSLSISFDNVRQSSTQRFLLFNPYFLSQFSISFTQQLLNGFGKSVGRRLLDVAENEAELAQEIVRLQANTTLAEAQNAYWDLVAALENVRVAEQSLEVAQRIHQDNRAKEEIGTVSGLDVVTAESEIAARRRDLASAQARMLMKEVDVKNVISRNLVELLGSFRIVPTDVLPDPRDEDIPKIGEALSIAMGNRPEIRKAEVDIRNQDIAIKYGKNLLKPSLLLFANFSSTGLYGNRIVENPDGTSAVIPGGISQAMRQVRNWRYPEYAVGFSFSLNIHNRSAEADYIRAKLEKQQAEISLQRARNTIAQEVRKAIIGLVQSKAQVEAARKAADLSAKILAAEETKLLEGAAVPYDVILRRREFRSAQFAEIQARAAYAKALVERDRAMGVLEPAGTE